jgi:hypothetical protein
LAVVVAVALVALADGVAQAVLRARLLYGIQAQLQVSRVR